jgi:hypothetical protein
MSNFIAVVGTHSTSSLVVAAIHMPPERLHTQINIIFYPSACMYIDPNTVNF